MRLWRHAVATLVLMGCSRAGSTGRGDSPPPALAPAAAPAKASETSGPSDAGVEGAPACEGDPSRGVTCLRFPTSAAALDHVMRAAPRVVAIGEAHAQKGTEDIRSSTRRFTEDLLPRLAPRAGDLVVELWAPDPSCTREVAAVASAQKPVTSAQSAENPNEYLALGTRAKELGVTPWLLRPTCADFADLADAGADAVPAMLGLVKRLTEDKVLRLAQKNAGLGKLTIAYGGALHNDLSPPESTAPYSFGPEVARAIGGAYVELDLIVPEFIKATPVWEKLPWYGAWTRASASATPQKDVSLYVIAHGGAAASLPPSYVLVFERR